MGRSERLDTLPSKWDVIVVGGGITGAGIFRESCRRGYRTLLLEQRDFAWGTSSRSGKMVHGGLRYILQGQITTSYHSVRERERLLRECSGLVNPSRFVFTPPWNNLFVRLGVRLFLAFYDIMAGRKSRRYHRQDELQQLVPGLLSTGGGGFSFLDATTDDARLVLRVLGEGRELGGTALTYAPVVELLRRQDGTVCGVNATDSVRGSSHELEAGVVINATGAWADELREQLGHGRQLRRLRGSHLVFPHARLPITRAVGLRSPIDGRNMYVIPWEGITLLGTTDIDHEPELDQEPRITPEEGEYLLTTINHWFPEANLTAADVTATQAGVRPVIDTGKDDPSKESREEMVWMDNGLVTISGGKLTTFAMMAAKTLKAATPWLPKTAAPPSPPDPGRHTDELEPTLTARIEGRYGTRAAALIEQSTMEERQTIAESPFLWAELRWAAREEQVFHLDDLLLRRTRLGLVLPRGGLDTIDAIQSRLCDDLDWDEDRWQEEIARYQKLWSDAYSPEPLKAG